MTVHSHLLTLDVGGHRGHRFGVNAALSRDRVPRPLQGQSRLHTQSDLDSFLRWCAHAELEPLLVRRVDVELYLRWMQVQRKYKPSTVSRRLSVVSEFYRTCVIDGVLEQSP